MSIAILHVLYGDGTHQMTAFDDQGMTMTTEPEDDLEFLGGLVRTTRFRVTLTGIADSSVAFNDTLDSTVVSLIAFLTKRATTAEREAKSARTGDVRARREGYQEALDAMRQSITAALPANPYDDANDDEQEGDL